MYSQIRYILTTFLSVLFLCNIAHAQVLQKDETKKDFKVLVVDKDTNPIPGVQVSINDLPFQSTNENGEFPIEPIESKAVKKVQALKNGMVLMSYGVSNQVLIIRMKRIKYYIVEVEAFFEDNSIARNIRFKLGGDGEKAKTAVTDGRGKFEVQYPVNYPKPTAAYFSSEKYYVTDAKVKTSSTRINAQIYVRKKPNFMIVGETFTIRLKDEVGEPVSGVFVKYGNSKYPSNFNGNARVIVRQPGASISVENCDILNADTLGLEVIELMIRSNTVFTEDVVASAEVDTLPTIDETLVEEEDSTVVGNIDAIISRIQNENDRLLQESEETQVRINQVASLLASDTTLTQEERQAYRTTLARLEETLTSQKALFEERQKLASEQLKTLDLSLAEREERLRLVQEKSDREAAEARKQFLSVVGVALVFLLIALLSIILARRFRRQKKQVEMLKEELEETVEQLETRKTELELVTDELSEKNEELNIKNESIVKSINYAQQIQSSILPVAKIFENRFTDHFIYYKPMEIVSGDFYWIKENVKSNDGKVYHYIAAVDCTGHGVPGAFMSMVGYTLLNQIVDQKITLETDTMLDFLNRQVIKALNQQESGNNDGMDLCLCRLEYLENDEVNVCFTGAKRPLYYRTQGEEVVEVEGSRKSIGGLRGKNRIFDKHEFKFKKGDTLYLTSDGYIDQAGKKRRHKFGNKRLTMLFNEFEGVPMSEQLNKLEEVMAIHQGEEKQRDDLTLLGIVL